MNNPTPAAGSDAGLTPVHGDTLSALMNMIVPRSPDGRMPGAGDLPELVHHLAATIPALREHLDMLDRDALARYGAAFGALDEVRRATLLEDLRSRNPQVLDRLALETVTCYYQQDRVLQGLGMEARPPYPKGYRVEPGDLSLLNPVIARGKIYREIP